MSKMLPNSRPLPFMIVPTPTASTPSSARNKRPVPVPNTQAAMPFLTQQGTLSKEAKLSSKEALVDEEEASLMVQVCKRSLPGPFWAPKWKLCWLLVQRKGAKLKFYSDDEISRHPSMKPTKEYNLVSPTSTSSASATVQMLIKDNDNPIEDDCGGKAQSSFVLCLNNGAKKMELGCENRARRQELVDFITLTINPPAARPVPDASLDDKENTVQATQVPTPLAMPLSKPILNPLQQQGQLSESEPEQERQRKQSIAKAVHAGAVSVIPALARPLPLPSLPATSPAMSTPSPLPLHTIDRSESQVESKNLARPALPSSSPMRGTLKAPLNVVAASSAISPSLSSLCIHDDPMEAPSKPAIKLELQCPAQKLAIAAPTFHVAPISPQPPAKIPATISYVAPTSAPLPLSTIASSSPTVSSVQAASSSAVISASTAPETISVNENEAKLLARHARLINEVNLAGPLAWDDEFQKKLRAARPGSSTSSSSPQLSPSEAAARAAALQTHVNEFKRTARHWAELIIQEYALPVVYKTVKPQGFDEHAMKMKKMKNAAEAEDTHHSKSMESYRFLVEGIAFEFAQAGETEEAAAISAMTKRGASSSSSSSSPFTLSQLASYADTLASKQATNELHAIQYLSSFSSGLPEQFCLPLMCLVDYLGFRLRCVATIPIYDRHSELVWGEREKQNHRTTAEGLSEGEDEVEMEFVHSSKVHALLVHVGQVFKLAPYEHVLHNVTIPISSVVQVFSASSPASTSSSFATSSSATSSSSDRFYLTRLHALMPIDLNFQHAVATGEWENLYETKTFRPEFLKNSTTPLCSDAYRRRRLVTSEDDDEDQDEAEFQRKKAAEDDDEEGDARAAKAHSNEAEEEEDHEANAFNASKRLQETLVVRFVHEMEKSEGGFSTDTRTSQQLFPLESADEEASSSPSPASSNLQLASCLGSTYQNSIADGDDLCRAMHAYSLNLRYLPLIARATSLPHLRMLALHEMIARCCKILLATNLRTMTRTIVAQEQVAVALEMTSSSSSSSSSTPALSLSSYLSLQESITQRLKEGATYFLNMVLGQSEDSLRFWRAMLFPDLRLKYRLDALSSSSSSSSFGFSVESVWKEINMPLLFQTLQRRCGLVCKAKTYTFGSFSASSSSSSSAPITIAQPIALEDFLGFEAHIKGFMPTLPIHEAIERSKATISAPSSSSFSSPDQYDWRVYSNALENENQLYADDSPMTRASPWRSLQEARPALRRLNRLMFAYLKQGLTQKAERCAWQVLDWQRRTALTAGSSSFSPSSFSPSSSLPSQASSSSPSSSPSRHSDAQLTTNALSTDPEHVKFLINLIWLHMLQPPSASAQASSSSSSSSAALPASATFPAFTSPYLSFALKPEERAKLIRNIFLEARELLVHSLSKCNPIMVSLHYAFMCFSSLSLSSSSSSSPAAALNASGNVTKLLRRCDDHSSYLFGEQRPLTLMLRLELAERACSDPHASSEAKEASIAQLKSASSFLTHCLQKNRKKSSASSSSPSASQEKKERELWLELVARADMQKLRDEVMRLLTQLQSPLTLIQ